MKKRFLVSLCLLVATLLIATGCHCRMSKEERKAFDDACIVFQYFPKSPDNSFSFDAGPYQGGTAIIGPKGVAFWVQDGKAYTVNQAAMDVAPALAQAPDNVKYDDAFITAAYCEQDEQERLN